MVSSFRKGGQDPCRPYPGVAIIARWPDATPENLKLNGLGGAFCETQGRVRDVAPATLSGHELRPARVGFFRTHRPGTRVVAGSPGSPCQPSRSPASAACLPRARKVVLQVISGAKYLHPIRHLQNSMTPPGPWPSVLAARPWAGHNGLNDASRPDRQHRHAFPAKAHHALQQ